MLLSCMNFVISTTLFIKLLPLKYMMGNDGGKHLINVAAVYGALARSGGWDLPAVSQ